ncbi:MAG: universal stress protein [Nitrospiraceae bacterium]|nr:universal stress protein [Nitrospiraceae bacterium]
MYGKILAAVNEHINSEVSARYAINLSKVTGSRLFLCHITPHEAAEEVRALSLDAVDRLLRCARSEGVTAEGVTGSGDVVAGIVRLVQREGIGLVFAATRRKDVERRFYAGTVARSLSIGLPCSVALVRVVHMGRGQPREILVPLKERMGRVTEMSYFVAMMARAFDSRVYLFHAAEKKKAVSGIFPRDAGVRPIEQEVELPPMVLNFIEQLEIYKVKHEQRLRAGPAGEGLTMEAAARRYGLIIMGASERSLLSSLIRGNPVEEAMRKTPCNLIVLTARHEH